MNNNHMSKAECPLDDVPPKAPLKLFSFSVVCDPIVSTVLIRLEWFY